jgi:integrase
VVAAPSLTHAQNDRPSSSQLLPLLTEPSQNPTPVEKSQASCDLLFGEIGPLVSSAAQQVIRQALAHSTAKSYESVLKPFKEYCENKGIVFANVTDVTFVNYAQKYASPDYAFSSLRLVFSAVKFAYESYNPGKVFESSLLSKFLKGAARICRIPKKSLFVWDPQIVIDHIQNREIPIKPNRLASEAAVLLALASAVRQSDLHRLGSAVQFWGKDELFIPFLEQQKSQRRPGIIISRYSNARTCPVVAITRYVHATKDLRKDQFLFVSSHSGIRCKLPTLKAWLLYELNMAGVHGASPGSTRSAAASLAFAANISFDAIAKLAGWRHEHTFQTHYHRKIVPRATNLLPQPIEPIEPDNEAFIFDSEVVSDDEFGTE